MINFQIEYEIGVTVQLGDNSHIAHKLRNDTLKVDWSQ